MKPKVTFRNPESARPLTDAEVDKRLGQGAVVHNTALRIREAKKLPGYGTKAAKLAFEPDAGGGASSAAGPAQAIQASDPSLTISDETAIAINPKVPNNIVAGAATFDGKTFNNSAFVSMDGGNTWKTITAIKDTDEGAGIAFDDSGNCYYVTMQGGFNPCCVVSQDGGLTWSAPAHFGSGDKTAVAARGKIALCGFDRLNTEACAFTLDGGNSWTVHDFTDSGLGTGPLVSYDEQYFYIVYGAMDNNLKIYVSADQGNTWTGPHTIVAGNAWSCTLPGPLSYQGDALTSPGTNVAIDGSGTLHVLYIDSTKLLPMYTSSSDHGLTWSAPINVNPERATDPHLFPCLSCSKDGDLLAGSMVYNEAQRTYSILRHTRARNEIAWTTTETDNGPWLAAGHSPGFRIGFGDYFDCDSLPQCGISAMAWSETPNGKQPWQSWARILDPIRKCETPCDCDDCCVSPCDPPWLTDDHCLTWYENRNLRIPITEQRPAGEAFVPARNYIEFRVTYTHRLCMRGKQQGSLLYTVTLLPGETVKLYHSDRYRRITSEQDRYSIQTTFMQFLSSIHQARVTDTLNALINTLASVKTGTSESVGGGLGSLLGLPSGSASVETGVTTQTSLQVGHVSDQFNQSVMQASQLTHAERSVVVSTYEDKETADITSRTLRNDNACRAVTYFVRKVVEVYSFSTVVSDVSYRIVAPHVPSDWHTIDDLGWLPPAIQNEIKNALKLLPKVGDTVQKAKTISLPTDGTVYDPELAHCCSCEPERAEAILIQLEKQKAEATKAAVEAQLLEMELQRRKLLLQKGDLTPFDPPTPAAGG